MSNALGSFEAIARQGHLIFICEFLDSRQGLTEGASARHTLGVYKACESRDSGPFDGAGMADCRSVGSLGPMPLNIYDVWGISPYLAQARAPYSRDLYSTSFKAPDPNCQRTYLVIAKVGIVLEAAHTYPAEPCTD